MKLALVGDVHAHFERLESIARRASRIAPVDLVLVTGDVGRDPTRPWRPGLSREQHDESVRSVLETIARAFDAPICFVPGNHDLPDPPRDLPAINVDGRAVEVAGLTVAGFGGSERSRLGFPYEWTEEAAGERLAVLPPCDILLSHVPPSGSRLGVTTSAQRVGSPAVREALTALRPALLVCGHIHEGWGLERIDAVPCVNAGALGEPRGQAIVWRVDWSDGPDTAHVHRDRPGGWSTVTIPIR